MDAHILNTQRIDDVSIRIRNIDIKYAKKILNLNTIISSLQNENMNLKNLINHLLQRVERLEE